MARPNCYIFESILDDVEVQDNTKRVTDTFVDEVNSELGPDPYEDTDYDFELFVDTPMIRLRQQHKIVSLICKWIQNLDAVMETSRQITRCTRSIFYSRDEVRLKKIVQDPELIRDPYDSRMYSTGLYLRFDHKFTTGAQIMNFIAQVSLCVASIEQLKDDRRNIVHIRLRYYKNGRRMEDMVMSHLSEVVQAVVEHKDISKYQTIEPTIKETTQFAFNLLHSTQEYKYNVYNSIRARLCPGLNLADWGAFQRVKDVFGEPDQLSPKTTEIMDTKSTFSIQSLLNFNPYRNVDGMIFPFRAQYIMKNMEYDGGYEEWNLDEESSYGNGRKRIQEELIEHYNGGSTVLPCGRPELYYTEWNSAKTKQGLKRKISLICGIGTVELHESGFCLICDVDFLMEIQIDSMFKERVVAFVDYMSRLLNLSNEECEIIRQEML